MSTYYSVLLVLFDTTERIGCSMIVLYILILAMIWYLQLKFSRNDYFDITALLFLGYLISAICCLYNAILWDVQLHFYTIVVLCMGFVSVGIGAKLGNVIGTNKQVAKHNSIYEVIERGYNTAKVICVIVLSVTITILLIREIGSIASLNERVWASTIVNYRRNMADDAMNANHSSIVDAGLRITRALAYIYLIIFVSTFYNKRNVKKCPFRWLYIIPAFLYAVQCIIRGVRIPILSVVIAAIFLFYFFYKYNKRWSGYINIKIIGRILIFGVIICIIFYYAKFFIGKMQDSNGVVAYVTNYLGGSLQLFDMYLSDTAYPSEMRETFAGMINSLKSFGLFENVKTVIQHEYRNASTGVYIGNIYTGFRNYYNDYGIIGMMFISIVFGFVFSKWYKTLKKRRYWNTNRVFSLILYSYLLYCVVFHFFTDYFFSLIAIGWIVNIIIMYMLCRIVFDIQIDVSKIYIHKSR